MVTAATSNYFHDQWICGIFTTLNIVLSIKWKNTHACIHPCMVTSYTTGMSSSVVFFLFPLVQNLKTFWFFGIVKQLFNNQNSFRLIFCQ